VETVIHSDHDFATVAYLRIKDATLQPKDVTISASAFVPPLLEPHFSEVYETARESEMLVTQPPYSPPGGSRSEYLPDTGISCQRLGRWVAISNVHRRTPTSSEVSITEEVEDCFHRLKGACSHFQRFVDAHVINSDALSLYALDISHCVNVNVYLSSMDDFAEMNASYTNFFGTSPPARACVGVTLPPPFHFQLDCIAYKEEAAHDRQTIHVQGLSYWAPANIGPYSQTITVCAYVLSIQRGGYHNFAILQVDGRVFVSGQIGLKPSSLTLPSPRSLLLESALTSQHVKRLTDVLGTNTGGWKGCTQSTIYWLVDARDILHVKKAHQTHEKVSRVACSVPISD
jgi:diphthine-ammonia ligase